MYALYIILIRHCSHKLRIKSTLVIKIAAKAAVFILPKFNG